MSHAKKWGSGIALLALAAIAGAAALNWSGVRNGGGSPQAGWSENARTHAAAASGSRSDGSGGSASRSPAAAAGKAAGARGTYTIVFREAALGTYRGGVSGLPAPQRRADARGKWRLDVKGVQARNYVDYLQRRQFEHEGRIGRALGRQPDVRLRMQHAINGIVTDLGSAEAESIRKLPGVMLVEAYREYALDTDTGPLLIGAEPVWTGTNPGAPAAYQGEGVVFGIIDTGINFGAPSFTEVDPVDGYQHVNPLGAGTYLGTCLAGGDDVGRCNAKLIGGYDFVCGAPGNQCGQPNIREEPGFGDTNGHGSHTASTAAGNRREVSFRGNDVNISGVAPRGNIVAFDVCYTNTTTGQGLCPSVSSAAAVNQAVADGIVDVLNFSIGGGAQPWSESVSLAFLGASNAGIYVAASAGNSGPGPNTMGHLEPWVSSTAAAQHGRGDFAVLMEVTGPGTVPEPLTAIVLNEGANGVPHTATIPGTTPLRVSAGIDTVNDGCVAYPAGTFTGAIAVIRRGTCPFADKANNASNAGAIAVVIANNTAGGIIPSVPGTSVPVFGALQSDGNAMRDFVLANPTATAMIGFPAMPLSNTVDALAAFSSRGPAGSFDLVKPDVTAPGVLVLAVTAGTTLTGFEQAIALFSGTSMASPHQAGAAGLIRQARPAWTVPEIKSALTMTADQTVLLEDQVTPADPFAAGGGRIRVDQAINAGLVLHETGANYLAANPGTGGDESLLNQPSMANRDCVDSCTFTRTFRNTLPVSQIWTLRVTGIAGSVSPKIIKIPAGASRTVQVTIDSSALPANGVWDFGTLLLKPSPLRGRRGQPMLRLPIAVAVQPPPP